MSTFKEALEAAKIQITKYDPTKARPVGTNIGTMDMRKFCGTLLERLGTEILKYPDIVLAAHDHAKMDELLAEHCPSEPSKEPGTPQIPEKFKKYTLNVDMSMKAGWDSFFITTPDEYKSRTTGSYYLQRSKIDLSDAFELAREVIQEYHPRRQAGVTTVVNGQTREEEKIFNSYIPAEWVVWKKENPKEWRKLPSKPPTLVMKVLKHLVPCPEERRYLYAWIYASLTSRSYVYLILCGPGGSGKNRLKILLRGLHGQKNAIDGKKSTLTERFNSQLCENTLVWFDELKHDMEMENVMKEIQNDYMAIEKKGIDATGSSDIHSSLVISNNKPKDNYLAFDARKFAPLVLHKENLKKSMTEEEIETYSQKVDPRKPGFDVKFVAQVAKWILRIGKDNLAKYPDLEYRGPMFWKLAHTSMTRWQKRAIDMVIEQSAGVKTGWDAKEGAFQWSKLEGKVIKRSGDKSMAFPDYSSVQAFFEIFRDANGAKAYNTKIIPGRNILGDFWIYPLLDHVEVITEASETVAQEREKGRKNGAKETYDL